MGQTKFTPEDDYGAPPRFELQLYNVEEPISTMTSRFVWNEPPNLRREDRRRILQEDYLICAPNNRNSNKLRVFKIVENGLVFRQLAGPFHYPAFNMTKSQDEIYVKMVLLRKSEENEKLYILTESKKILKIDFVPHVKNLPIPEAETPFQISNFSSEAYIREAEHIDQTTYFLGCSQLGLCAIIDFENPQKNVTLINVGSGYSQIHVLKTSKLFAVTYPDTNSVSFYNLTQAGCTKAINKECDGLDTEKAFSCYPHSHIHPVRGECVCDKGYYFDERKVGCFACHANCTHTCNGPASTDCAMQWYYDSRRRVRFNFTCYDDPAEWFNPDVLVNDCVCFEGYKAENGHCMRCPVELEGCITCSQDLTTCLNCDAGYVLENGRCKDCGDPNYTWKNCTESISFLQMPKSERITEGGIVEVRDLTNVFDLNTRVVNLTLMVNSASPARLLYEIDFMYVDLYYPGT